MFITNPEILHQENLYYCYDIEFADQLCKKGFIPISKKYDGDKIIAFVFYKTVELKEVVESIGKEG